MDHSHPAPYGGLLSVEITARNGVPCQGSVTSGGPLAGNRFGSALDLLKLIDLAVVQRRQPDAG